MPRLHRGEGGAVPPRSTNLKTLLVRVFLFRCIMNKLLTRDQFREGTFARDNYTCVFCDKPAKDAHHIIERRLWPDSGYYLNNGTSVCEEHHLACEMTTISVEQVREACKINKPIIPEDMYDDQIYDKWGNIILPNGQRTKGPLFYDESVQKILREGRVLDLFTDYAKYPRTYHLPFSGCVSEDDRQLKDCSQFENKRVIVTEKLDGENTSLYQDYYHARSIDSRNHPSRNWAKALHSKFAYDIPRGWRFCCENLYAVHSIAYTNLESYLYGISVWNDKNICLDWDSTVEWFSLVNLPVVPVLYDGIFDEDLIKGLYNEKKDWKSKEGYVIRNASSFRYIDFKHNVAKYVRPNHIQTTKHWMAGTQLVVNQLK